MSPHTGLVLLATSATLLNSGCIGPLNNEVGIGNRGVHHDTDSQWIPPTLEQHVAGAATTDITAGVSEGVAPVFGVDGPEDPQVSQTSIQSLDRTGQTAGRAWKGYRIEVPDDAASHQARMTKNVLLKKNSPRAKGEYPGEEASLFVSSKARRREEAAEAVIAPFAATGDLVLLVPRAAASKPIRGNTRTGSFPYQRWPNIGYDDHLPIIIAGPASTPHLSPIENPTPSNTPVAPTEEQPPATNASPAQPNQPASEPSPREGMDMPGAGVNPAPTSSPTPATTPTPPQ